jgi:RNA polymerase sigma-70 factor (ECF subfamily)
VRDSAEFDAVFDQLFPEAARLAFRIVGNRAAAEDVAAEAFARALARWSTVGSLPYREAWVLRVTINLAVDTTRRKRPCPERDHERDTTDIATLRIALAHALGTLPRRQREAIGLRYLSDMTDQEVADVLGISEGTVRTHIRRGLRTLRVRFKDDIGEHLGYT